MIDKNEFLKKYNMEERDIEEAKLTWEELERIYDSYCCLEPKLREISKDFVDDYLYDIEKAGIHSYRDGSDRNPCSVSISGGLDPFSQLYHDCL